MLSRTMVAEIHRLLLAGELSHRKIAAELGVSRGTVHNIATGKRGLFGHDPDEATDGSGDLAWDDPARLGRCPNCGWRVYLPCVACRAEDYCSRGRSGRWATGGKLRQRTA